MFQWTREVPAEWQRDLESIVPRSDNVNWLKIVWEPGFVDEGHGVSEPVQRWEIRELIPRLEFVTPEIVESLQGPDPRTVGQFMDLMDERDAMDRPTYKKYWVSDSLVSHTQWKVFQETGCYSQRFWVIQGTKGGHKFRLSNEEQRILLAMGLEYDTPAPGDLPYAEYNQLTHNAIAEIDRLRKWRQSIGWDDRQLRKTEAGLYVRNDRNEQLEKWSWEMQRWLDNMIEDQVRGLPRDAIPDVSDWSTAKGSIDADKGAVEKAFIEEIH